MIYKFKSKAAGDVIMLAASAEPILRLEAAQVQAEKEAAADGRRAPAGEAVSLRQRAWPLVEMLKRSHAANAVIVWGV